MFVAFPGHTHLFFMLMSLSVFWFLLLLVAIFGLLFAVVLFLGHNDQYLIILVSAYMTY